MSMWDFECEINFSSQNKRVDIKISSFTLVNVYCIMVKSMIHISNLSMDTKSFFIRSESIDKGAFKIKRKKVNS